MQRNKALYFSGFIITMFSAVLLLFPANAAVSDTIADLELGQNDGPTAFTASGANAGNGTVIGNIGFDNPQAVAIDSAGHVYVSDNNNNRVLAWVDAASLTNGAAADKVFGQLGSFTTNTANNGGRSADSLNAPSGVAVDSLGNLYVADFRNNRVLVYLTPYTTTTEGTGDTTADIVFGQRNSFTTGGDNKGGISARSLNGPRGVALDSAGNLYIADFGNNRVLEYKTPLTANLAADSVFGQGGDFTTSDANHPFAIVSASSLNGPVGVALDSAGNLYVGDFKNNRVLEYNTPLTTDTVADVVFGQGGDFTTADSNHPNTTRSASSLSNPSGVAVDSQNNLYVADSNNNRVLVYYTPLTTDTIADGGNPFGQPGFSTNDCPLPEAVSDMTLCLKVDHPSLAVDAARNLWVADSGTNRVLRYDTPVPSGGTTTTTSTTTSTTTTTTSTTTTSTTTTTEEPSTTSTTTTTTSTTTTSTTTTTTTTTLITTTSTTTTTSPATTTTSTTATTGPITTTTTTTTTTHPNSSTTTTVTLPLLGIVRSFVPNNGFAGTRLTISGSGFTGVTGVQFNGIPAAMFTVLSPTRIQAIAPSAACPGTGPVSVITPNGTAAAMKNFTCAPAIINSFTPNKGPADTGVTIIGKGFTDVTDVRFNGNSVGTFTVLNSTRIQAAIPAGACPAAGQISVVTPGATAVSAKNFTCAATLTRFTPNKGSVETTVTISGTGFTGATAVLFNGIPAAIFNVLSSSRIQATVPSGACPTAGPISVSTLSGTVVSVNNFICAATLTSFTPNKGIAGKMVTISGTGFAGATAVQFNGVPAAMFNVLSSTRIQATVPVGATTGMISVNTPSGTVTSSRNFVIP